MKVTKGKKEYVCAMLKAGYFETGILNTFFNGSSNDLNLPAFFWTDNCDYDAGANCYMFLLVAIASQKEVMVYIPREYVLAILVRKTAPPSAEMGKIGFKLPEASRG